MPRVLVSNRGILIRGREIRAGVEMKKCISEDGSRVTFTSRVLFHRRRHYCRCLPTLFHVLALSRTAPSPSSRGGSSGTCHGKTLSSTRIKRVLERTLLPRSACYGLTHRERFERSPSESNALPGYARVLPVGNTRDS